MTFTVINEEFDCRHCATHNEKLAGGCRNHCKNCLYSLHLDESNPGDRQSDCHGLMTPFKIDHSGKKGWMIYHKCEKCGKIIPNKTADDDNFEEIIKISNEQTRSKKIRRKDSDNS